MPNGRQFTPAVAPFDPFRQFGALLQLRNLQQAEQRRRQEQLEQANAGLIQFALQGPAEVDLEPVARLTGASGAALRVAEGFRKARKTQEQRTRAVKELAPLGVGVPTDGDEFQVSPGAQRALSEALVARGLPPRPGPQVRAEIERLRGVERRVVAGEERAEQRLRTRPGEALRRVREIRESLARGDRVSALAAKAHLQQITSRQGFLVQVDPETGKITAGTGPEAAAALTSGQAEDLRDRVQTLDETIALTQALRNSAEAGLAGIPGMARRFVGVTLGAVLDAPQLLPQAIRGPTQDFIQNTMALVQRDLELGRTREDTFGYVTSRNVGFSEAFSRLAAYRLARTSTRGGRFSIQAVKAFEDLTDVFRVRRIGAITGNLDAILAVSEGSRSGLVRRLETAGAGVPPSELERALQGLIQTAPTPKNAEEFLRSLGIE